MEFSSYLEKYYVYYCLLTISSKDKKKIIKKKNMRHIYKELFIFKNYWETNVLHINTNIGETLVARINTIFLYTISCY